MFSNRIECHSHTEFSNLRMLDCTNKVEQLIDKAVSIGLKGIAITDHESLSGHVRAIQYVKKQKEKGVISQDFKLVLGNEIYLVDSLKEVKDNYIGGNTKFYHFILLAKDDTGHKQLRQLSSLAWDNSFFTGRTERVPSIKSTLESVMKKDRGHLIASTSCIGGELGQHILSGQMQKAIDFVVWCKNIFGEDFYLEIQPSNGEQQQFVNQTILKLSKEWKIPFIITTDAHYLEKGLASVHESYLNSRSDISREVEGFYKYTYLMDSKEIHKILDCQIGYEAVELGLKNTLVIGNKVQEYDLYCPTIVPNAEIPFFKVGHLFEKWYKKYEYISKFANSSNVYDRYLLKLIEDGFYEKRPFNTLTNERFFECLDRIEIELKEMWLVTEKLGASISSYYLSTLELIEIMWNEGDSLVGVARGSVTGMFTMYLIGITQMNPIQWNLPHWRHISHEKIELSDVDIDTQANRREKIIEVVKRKKGERKVLNCCTFKTEGSKSAILTAGRGLGLQLDITSYLANMIPVTRGFTWTLQDCVYGNKEEEREPIKEFVHECSKYPLLLDTAMAIEGLVCGRSIHASAVYLFNDDFTEHNARMKAPNGVSITQFNMKDSDYCSGLKMDFLTVQGLDKIRHCLDLLIKAGHMKWQGSLRKTYDKYLHPDVLDYDTSEMWDMVADNKVTDLFQFDTQVGLQAAQRIKPHSLVELAAANSIMRLMVTGENNEQPIDTYIRYKNDINQWYHCMQNDYHLTEQEMKTLEKYLLPVYGVGDTQEIVMELSMDRRISGFNVTQANKLRKGIAKKDKELQAQMKEMFFTHGKEIGTSENVLSYIWQEVIGKQLGYSFSKNHTFPYSAIGLQELNLAYHYPIIYWNTACLIVNAGADDSMEQNKTTQYGKMAAAISQMQKAGITVSLPLINETKFSFVPDESNNRILFGLKGLCGVGDEIARVIIQNQPYMSFEDFCSRMVDTKLVQVSKMLILIKAGCFTELDHKNREITMDRFFQRYMVQPLKKLTISQLNRIRQLNMIPDRLKLTIRFYDFKNYVLQDCFLYQKCTNSKKPLPKKGYHDRYFKLDKIAQPFFQEHFSDKCVMEVSEESYVISENLFLKEVEENLIPLKDWLADIETVGQYNTMLLQEIKSQHAAGSISHWEMQSLSFYHGKHELESLNENQYGIVNFFALSEQPQIYDYYSRYLNGEKKMIPKFEISRLAGTVLDSDNNKHIITLLTKYGVVNVKLNRGQYSFYNKRISARLNEKKENQTMVEDSWFKRGSLLILCGYRQEQIFRCYRYADTIYTHTISKINKVYGDGTALLITERNTIHN